jgi:hypothetical protein
VGFDHMTRKLKEETTPLHKPRRQANTSVSR